MARTFLTASSEYLYNLSPPITVAPYSVSCLYNYTDSSVNDVIFSLADKDVADQVGILYASNTDKLAWTVAAGGAFGQTDPMSVTTSPNTWNHAGVIEYSSNLRACFMNGEKQTSSLTRNPTGEDRFTISVRADSNLNLFFGGSLAEFGWWDIALADAEMEMLNNRISPLKVRPQNLVVYVPLIRDDDNDLIGGLSMSVNGTPTVSAHPRILYPRK